jgi:hypothetical protein
MAWYDMQVQEMRGLTPQARSHLANIACALDWAAHEQQWPGVQVLVLRLISKCYSSAWPSDHTRFSRD